MFSFFQLAVVVIHFYGQELSFHFSVGSCCYTFFVGKSYVPIFFRLAVVVIHFYGQELSSHFFCLQLLLYIFVGKS